MRDAKGRFRRNDLIVGDWVLFTDEFPGEGFYSWGVPVGTEARIALIDRDGDAWTDPMYEARGGLCIGNFSRENMSDGIHRINKDKLEKPDTCIDKLIQEELDRHAEEMKRLYKIKRSKR